jgi:hypothetical protein
MEEQRIANAPVWDTNDEVDALLTGIIKTHGMAALQSAN